MLARRPASLSNAEAQPAGAGAVVGNAGPLEHLDVSRYRWQLHRLRRRCCIPRSAARQCSAYAGPSDGSSDLTRTSPALDELNALLRRLVRAARRQLANRLALQAALGVVLLAAPAVVLVRTGLLDVPMHAALWAPALGGSLMALVAYVRARPDAADVARAADRHLRLEERLSTAAEFARDGERPELAERLARQLMRRRVSGRAADVFPCALGPAGRLLPVAGIVLVMAFTLDLPVHAPPRAEPPSVAQAVERVASSELQPLAPSAMDSATLDEATRSGDVQTLTPWHSASSALDASGEPGQQWQGDVSSTAERGARSDFAPRGAVRVTSEATRGSDAPESRSGNGSLEPVRVEDDASFERLEAEFERAGLDLTAAPEDGRAGDSESDARADLAADVDASDESGARGEAGADTAEGSRGPQGAMGLEEDPWGEGGREEDALAGQGAGKGRGDTDPQGAPGSDASSTGAVLVAVPSQPGEGEVQRSVTRTEPRGGRVNADLVSVSPSSVRAGETALARDGVPPRYRALVEAYFTRLGESE